MIRLYQAVVFLFLVCLALSQAEPVLYIQPRDGIKPIIDLIKSAKKSIRLKIYLFTDSRQDVIDELVAAKNRGVDVKVLFEREPEGNSNSPIFLKMIDLGLDVKRTLPFRFVFSHEKSFVIDDQIGLISTANLTASSFSANREYLVKIDDPSLVAEMATVFDADWAGVDIDLASAKLIWSPSIIKSDGLVRGNSRQTILNLINNAKNELILEENGLVDEETIRTLIKALERGVKVTLIGTPGDPATETYFVKGAERVRAAGAKLYYLNRFVHAKVIVADGTKALVGSINLSANSLDANRELGVTLTTEEAPTALAELQNQLVADIAVGSEVNPFTLPQIAGIQKALEMDQFAGRIGTFEGRVMAVERRSGVTFLQFAEGTTAPRAVIFPANYDKFGQPFPDFYLGKTIQISGRVQLYDDYYEIIVNNPDQIKVIEAKMSLNNPNSSIFNGRNSWMPLF